MWPFSAWSESKLISDTINSKRDQQADAIARGLKVANADEAASAEEDVQYLSASASRIASQVRAKEWTARRVMEAYVRSAARAHSRTNCLTEIMFVQALDEADRLDDFVKTASQEELDSKLLLGVPSTVKDHLDYKGVDNSRGFVRYSNLPSERDSAVVEVLREAGAIVFCKTNVPQTMLAFECSNPVFGKTLNPYSPDHTSGGSSGGEAACLALDGSAMGIGSDIGGSLRIPTSYCGCYALKPVFGRFPTRGSEGVVPGYDAIKSTLGPMGRSVQDVALCMRVFANASVGLSPYSLNLLPMPYRETELPKKLRIGYYTEDGLVSASPACERAVAVAVEAARAAGHECIPVTLPDPTRALEIFQALSSSDAYRTLTSHLYPRENREPALFLPILGARIPAWLRGFSSWVLRSFLDEKTFARIIAASGEKKTALVWNWQNERDEYGKKIKELLWKELELDTVICPVQASPAVSHGSTKRLSPLALQTIYWNVVDSTVGVIPVTRVAAELDALSDKLKQEKIEKAGSRLLAKEYYSTVYNPTAMQGLPVGIQIVGPAWHEEKVLQIMEVLDDALAKKQGRLFGPGVGSQYESRKG